MCVEKSESVMIFIPFALAVFTFSVSFSSPSGTSRRLTFDEKAETREYAFAAALSSSALLRNPDIHTTRLTGDADAVADAVADAAADAAAITG